MCDWRVEFRGELGEDEAIRLGEAGIEYVINRWGDGRHAVIVEAIDEQAAVRAVCEALAGDPAQLGDWRVSPM